MKGKAAGNGARGCDGGGGVGPGGTVARRGGGRRAHDIVGEAEDVPARRVPHLRPEAGVFGFEVRSPSAPTACHALPRACKAGAAALRLYAVAEGREEEESPVLEKGRSREESPAVEEGGRR